MSNESDQKIDLKDEEAGLRELIAKLQAESEYLAKVIGKIRGFCLHIQEDASSDTRMMCEYILGIAKVP